MPLPGALGDELPPGDGARILAEEILPAVLHGAVAQERPVVVFVAGQAGSGKTLVVDLLHAALAARGGARRFRRQLAACDRRVHDPRLPEDWALAADRDAERAAALAEPVRRTAQPLKQAPGVDYHRLSADEHRFIFEVIVPTMLEPVTPQDQPVVAAVPGDRGDRGMIESGQAAAARPINCRPKPFSVSTVSR